MKISLLICLFLLASVSTKAQSDQIGIIDFYGLHTLSELQARQALQIKEGESLPTSRVEAQRRLESLPNVQEAHLDAVCCEAGKAILYVGIKEKGAPSLQFRVAPTSSIRLPDRILRAGNEFQQALIEAVQKGDVAEDDSQGHALNSNPKLRAVQEQFIAFAAQDLKLLRKVLHRSGDAQNRALAAEIIAYTSNKQDVVKDLVYGMSDPDSGVRNNSMRALGVIADYALASPKRRINVPIEPFIDMLNSLVWTDRNKSSLALYRLTQKRDATVLAKVRQRAFEALIEMARWKSPGHALAPFFLLGRIGNLPEEEIFKQWSSGNRTTLIETVLKKVKSGN